MSENRIATDHGDVDGNIGYLVDSQPRTLRVLAKEIGAKVLGAVLPTPEQPTPEA